jgi:putative hemolysin
MGILAFEALIILALISCNGFFALAEIAIVSARKSKLRQLANQGHPQANAAVALANEPELFLSSVQVGITLIGILSGAFGGATIAEVLADRFARLPWLAPYAETAGLALVVLFILFLSVVLGELVPKQLALSHPERFALLVAIPMQIIARIAAPIVGLFGGSSRIVLRGLGVTPVQEAAITDEEITFLVDEGVHHGAFDRVEHVIVERALHLDDREVAALMTPRVDVVWLDQQASNAEVRDVLTRMPFSVYPVCRDTVDQIIGTVHAHDVYTRLLRNEPALVPEIMHAPFVIPSNISALRAVSQLRQSGEHLAVIVSEYGETDGILTATDILEALVGVLTTSGEPDIVRREEGSWSVDGATRIDDVRALLQEDLFPEDETDVYHTIAGFILHRLGRIPDIGDTVQWEGFRFEVVDKDGNRIDRVLIERL